MPGAVRFRVGLRHAKYPGRPAVIDAVLADDDRSGAVSAGVCSAGETLVVAEYRQPRDDRPVTDVGELPVAACAPHGPPRPGRCWYRRTGGRRSLVRIGGLAGLIGRSPSSWWSRRALTGSIWSARGWPLGRVDEAGPRDRAWNSRWTSISATRSTLSRAATTATRGTARDRGRCSPRSV